MSLENVVTDNNSENVDPDFVLNNDTGTAIALPKTVSALMDQQKNKTLKTLHDQVTVIYLSLYETKEFQELLEAVYNEQSVEGTMAIDDVEAARMLRDYAESEGNGYVARQKLGTLVRSLRVVMRRYRVGREERRI